MLSSKSHQRCGKYFQKCLISSFCTCHYAVLGIDRGASEKDIRSAYLQMAKKHHPDVNIQIDSTQKFSIINEAYSILSDKTKKQNYDSQIGNLNQSKKQNFHHSTSSSSARAKSNWWDFNFYGNNQQNNNYSKQAHQNDDYSDFYDDFARFTASHNYKKTKKKEKKTDHNNNPYADYYYYYQQMNETNHKRKKYQNIWTDFEFDFDAAAQSEFDSEFNNDAFWRFLRKNNKQKRAKHQNENGQNTQKEKTKKHKNANANANEQNSQKRQTKNCEKNEKKSKKKKTQKQQQQNNHHHQNDIVIDLNLSFLDAANGCSKNISFERNELCKHCGGTSFEPMMSASKCIKCDGKGVVMGYGHDFVKHKCANCDGRGVVFKNCSNCNGKSIVNVSKSLSVSIPSGIRENDRVRVSKQGHQYMHMSNNSIRYGHIWINCKIAKHEYFVRINNDIHITMNIPYVLAVLGGSFVVPTIDGPNILKVLPGINSNDYECMQLKGIYDSSTNKKGHQYIHFIINVPKLEQLTAEQKNALNEFVKMEQPPTPIQTPYINDLRHFKKHSQKVSTYQEKEKEKEDDEELESEYEDDESSDDDDYDYDEEDEDEIKFYHHFKDEYRHNRDIDDDLDDLL